MSVQICKSGIVSAENIIESDCMILNTFTSESYTPWSGQNATMGKQITGFIKGKQYYIEMTVSWSGFKTDAADNFNMWAQGAAYDGSEWTWSYGNPMTAEIGNFKSLVLSADFGSKYFKKKFTASWTGYQLGCRTDYSNGKGTITYSNIKVIPADSYVDCENSYGKILTDSIAMDDFIEN